MSEETKTDSAPETKKLKMSVPESPDEEWPEGKTWIGCNNGILQDRNAGRFSPSFVGIANLLLLFIVSVGKDYF